MNRFFKILVIFVLLFLSGTSFAQKKHQGLLWEITGNGLSSPSYLYGTMHVSNKLAFNVSDSFYICLKNVEGVALESSPADWMQEYRDMGAFSMKDYDYGSDFYTKAFKISEPKTDAIYNLLENKNSLMNQILYRFNPGNADYQENTFLDMFIYQAGAKNGKPIHPLEDFEEVMQLSIKSMTPDKDKKRDNNTNNYLDQNNDKKFELLEEAYRRGDLDQIDSLSKADNPTEVYHHYFIVERNRNMVKRMDSIMKHHSIFTGIGAAHLPGNEGAIELLRDLGYQVRPVSTLSSGKSHDMRKVFENQYKPVEFLSSISGDNFLKTLTPGTFYEMPTFQRGKMEYLCPEPINGGYFSVLRLFTFGPIFGKDPSYYQSKFDSLLYIATPGELMKKEDIQVNGYSGYNIVTKTSKNDIVQYNVVFTPTEIVVLKGNGIDNYIEKDEPQSFFDKLELRPGHSNWNECQPKYGGAAWKMKGLITGQDMIEGLDEDLIDPIYQSFDQESGTYYQVLRFSLNDLDYIESDSFDLAFLGVKYAENIGYRIEQTNFEAGPITKVTQELKSKEDSNQNQSDISIQLLTRAGLYYLMSTTADDEDKEQFFNSFEFKAFDFEKEYEEFTDSTMCYKVNTLKKEDKPNYQELSYNLYNNYYDEDLEDKSYMGNSNSKMHYSIKSNESIYVGFTKFHDYDGAENLEAFWNYRLKRLAKENQMVVSRKSEKEIDGNPSISFMLSDTGSAKGILTKLILKQGVVYTLQSLIDTIQGPSKYVSTFYETFKPLDTLIGRDIFENKAELFFSNIIGKDSLGQVNAMKSIKKIDFTEDDIENIIKTYNNFNYSEKEEKYEREDIIVTLGNIEDEKAYDFLYQVYDDNYFTSDIQFSVLKCFSYTESKEAYEAIESLLLDHTPFTEKKNKLKFFDNLYDSLELAEDYFPKMLELSQYPEYKPYVVELLSYGYLTGVFNYKSFKKEKSSIYRNANIELKRTVANQEDNSNQFNSYYNSANLEAKYHSLFLDYYTLMCGFKKNKEKGTEKFFNEIYRIKDMRFQLEAEIIHNMLGLEVDTAVINTVCHSLDFKIWAYNRLKKNEMLSYFPSNISQEDMAFASLYNYGYDEESDSVEFVKKVLVNNGKSSGYIYFFKRKTEKMKNWMVDYIGLMPQDLNQFNTKNPTIKKGLSIRNNEELELTIKKTIEIFELENRKRVVLTSFEYGGWGGLF